MAYAVTFLTEDVLTRIPDDLINRIKQWFVAPMKDWFDDETGVRMANDLMSFFFDKTDFLHKCLINRHFQSGTGPYLWPAINFAYWYNYFFDKKVTVG